MCQVFLMDVQVHGVKSPVRVDHIQSLKADDSSTVHSVASSQVASYLSSPSRTHVEWVHRVYKTHAKSQCTETNPRGHDGNQPLSAGGAAFLLGDDISDISSDTLASSMLCLAKMNARNGLATTGAVIVDFSDNVKATELLRETAEKMMESKDGSLVVPGWAKLFGFNGLQRSSTNHCRNALVLPERDSMVPHFLYDGKERMVWRALKNGRSVACTLVPSTRWYSCRLAGIILTWKEGETTASEEDSVSFDLRARRKAKGRFEVTDKFGNISASADAPSDGAALLAVLLSALEGPCKASRTVNELEWGGGAHRDDGFISVE